MRRVASLLAFLLATGCGFSDDYSDRLDAWREGNHAFYTWTVVVSEPLMGPRRTNIDVRDGVPIRAHSREEDLEINGSDVEGVNFGTVDELIEWLVRYSPEAITVQVEWAPEGFPSRYYLDQSTAIDDEVTVRVVSFHPLGGSAKSAEAI